MGMNPEEFIHAARVPMGLTPQSFGLWRINRKIIADLWKDFEKHPPRDAMSMKLWTSYRVGFESYTLLTRWSLATLHLNTPEVVMEDSWTELQKHLPIWMRARGKVLVTGLGLGCVVRGLLANPEVKHITVVELDKDILRVVGHEFLGNHRVELVHCDALKFQPNGHKWDFAWHDLWTDGDENLQCLHARLFVKYNRSVAKQGAWMFRHQVGKRRFNLPSFIFG